MSSSYSTPALLLPYIEQETLQKLIDFTHPVSTQVAVSGVRVPILMCPSEINDKPNTSVPGTVHYPLNYAVSAGNWFQFDPATGPTGAGAFAVNTQVEIAMVLDGLSNTAAMSEVKADTPLYRDGGNPAGLNAPIPAPPADLIALGGPLVPDLGHSQWLNGIII